MPAISTCRKSTGIEHGATKACRGMCGGIHSEGARCGASGQGATTTDFVASAPYVFLATVPVELPSVGAVQALSLFVAGADPQDGPGEPSMPLMAAG